MGAVWLAEHALLGRRAAVKVLLREYSANEQIVQRFFNEAKAVTAIADPGIVQVFDFGYHTDGSAYLVMEVLEGDAMDARLRQIGRFKAADAVRLMAQIATSLGAAHAKGVVHRDLKPENIFIVGDRAVTGGERTKILDFGIAKLAGDDPGRAKTRTGTVMGTPVYMSPEQCRGLSQLDSRSDIYALGCVLFTMLTGRPPFDSETTGDLIIAHVTMPPPAPSSVVPELPVELDAVVLRCLEKDPARRYQTTLELVQALGAVEPILYGLTSSAGPGGYRPAHTPAAALAYRQQPTPAPVMSVSPTAGTTLGSAALPVHPTQPPAKSKKGLVIGVVAMLGAAGAIAVVMATSSGGSGGETDGSGSAGSAGVAAHSPPPPPPPPAVDAGVTPPPPDAAVAATPPVDAPEVVATPADAGVLVDAGTIKASKNPKIKRSGGDSGTKRGNNGTSTGSGTVDRGD